MNTRAPFLVGHPPTLTPRRVSTASRSLHSTESSAQRSPETVSIFSPSRAILLHHPRHWLLCSPISVCSAANAACYGLLGVGNARELCLWPACRLTAASDSFQGGLCVGRLSCRLGTSHILHRPCCLPNFTVCVIS